MTLEVDIDKTVHSAQRSFRLQVRFTASARRSVIFGPSGAGKSMTLQAIAGLLTPDAGRIAFDGDPLFDAGRGIDRPARERRFGYLFQDYALFPKLNVRQNIAFGLARGWRNPPRDADGAEVDRWLRAFGLVDVAAQRPAELSGGQRQRTALARALVHAPRALLLDEPFAALDPALRDRMRTELDELLRRIDIPVLMITHDPEDLHWFGDECFRLEDGMIDETPWVADRVPRGTPAPRGPLHFASTAEGLSMKSSARNQFTGTVHGVRAGAINDEIDLDVGGGLHIVATVTRESRDALGLAQGRKAFALVKASSVMLVTDAEDVKLSARNQLKGTVARVVPGAVNTEVRLDLPGGGQVVATVTNDSAETLQLAPGASATALFKASSVIVGVAA